LECKHVTETVTVVVAIAPAAFVTRRVNVVVAETKAVAGTPLLAAKVVALVFELMMPVPPEKVGSRLVDPLKLTLVGVAVSDVATGAAYTETSRKLVTAPAEFVTVSVYRVDVMGPTGVNDPLTTASAVLF